MRTVLAIALAALTAACDSPASSPRAQSGVARGDGARCETLPSAPGCRFELQRADDAWRTSGFGGY